MYYNFIDINDKNYKLAKEKCDYITAKIKYYIYNIFKNFSYSLDYVTFDYFDLPPSIKIKERFWHDNIYYFKYTSSWLVVKSGVYGLSEKIWLYNDSEYMETNIGEVDLDCMVYNFFNEKLRDKIEEYAEKEQKILVARELLNPQRKNTLLDLAGIVKNAPSDASVNPAHRI